MENEFCGHPGAAESTGLNKYFKLSSLDILPLMSFEVTEANERKFNEWMRVFLNFVPFIRGGHFGDSPQAPQ